MSVVIGIGFVTESVDPESRARIKVLAQQFHSDPFWCLPAMEPGLFSVPIEGDAVLVLRTGPNSYLWKATSVSRNDALPAWAADEYPRRKALYGNGALVGIDEGGTIYVGHFDASQSAVLGDMLKTKLEALCDALISALDLTATSTAGGYPLTNAAGIQAAKASIQTIKGQLSQVLSGVVKVASTENT